MLDLTRFAALLILCVLSAFGQASTSSSASTPAYGYFGEIGGSYDYYGHAPAATVGFGVRIGDSKTILVTDVDTPLGPQAAGFSTIRETMEYHVVQTGNWELLGFGAVGATTNGSTAVASFAGGAGVSYDIGSLLSKGKLHLPAVFQVRLGAITGTQVKPTYGLMFRKTF